MKTKAAEIIAGLQGKKLVTAESITGGGIGALLTSVPGSSAVYKGGIVSYTNWVKEKILGVPGKKLDAYGAVSRETAQAMVCGVRRLLQADVAVAVTGLAGPGGDEYGNPVGTVFIAYEDAFHSEVRRFLFSGDREHIRNQTVEAALDMICGYLPD